MVFKYVFALISLFTFLHAGAQVTQGDAPAASTTGPLKVKISGGNITVHSLMMTKDASPVIQYTLVNNTSGATIVSQGTYNFGGVSGGGSQDIVVNPGTVSGSFVIQLQVTSGGKTAKSSSTVAVVN